MRGMYDAPVGLPEHCFVLYQDFGHSYDFMSEQFIYVQIPAKLTDGTVTPSGREGDGDFCEYPGEVEEDDRGVGAKANRDRRDPMDRPPVRGRARSAAAHHDSVHVP